MNNYWSYKENELIKQYYYCSSASTSAETRNLIFFKLEPKFLQLINQSIQQHISSFSKEDKEDIQQELLIKIFELLKNLDIEKIQGILNFLWISVNNYLFTLIRKSKQKKKIVIDYNSDLFELYNYSENNIEIESKKKDTILEICTQLDSIIFKEKQFNRRNTLYVCCLKEYLIENNFNGEGFKEFIKEKLNLTDGNFYRINFLLNIRSKIFNDNKIK